MQETWVRFLIQEDPTCLGTAKPMCHNYWACALEPGSCNYWVQMPQLLKPLSPRAHAPQQEKLQQWEACILQLESRPCTQQLEKSPCSNEDPAEPKINTIFFKKVNFLKAENALLIKPQDWHIYSRNICWISWNSSLTNERDWPLWTYLSRNKKIQSYYSTCKLLHNLVPVISLISSPSTSSTGHFTVATLAFLLVFTHARHSLAPGPLQWLVPQPRTPFPRYPHG